MKTLLASKGILVAGQGLTLNRATTADGLDTDWRLRVTIQVHPSK